jgi:glutamate--cysteine ligase
MITLRDKYAEGPVVPLHNRAVAETYVASVCFKHGPPRLVGVELEWTVHHAHDPRQEIDLRRLGDALGPHAPDTLRPESPQLPLPGGGMVTVEPGGQVEISSPPDHSLAAVITSVSADTVVLAELLGSAGMVLGEQAIDAHRTPRRLLETPRYAAMEKAFAPRGPDGIAWMCGSAGLQVCLDAGEPGRVAHRWAALHALGPVLSALFANSTAGTGRYGAWSSSRMGVMFGADPERTRPPVSAAKLTVDPAAAWASYALDLPVICVRRPGASWDPPADITFADWIDGALPERPTTDDLDYHLTTLFPPVRPHGYLEVRYLDAQRGDGWIVPAVLLAALMADERVVDEVLDAAAPAGGRWLPAARAGLADPGVAEAAMAIVALGERALADPGNTIAADIGADLAALVTRRLHARLSGGDVS